MGGEQQNYDEHQKLSWCPKESAGDASYEQARSLTKRSRLDPFDDQVHKLEWSDIEKISLLGEGSFSQVHKARINVDGLDSKLYAVKHLKPGITQGSQNFDLAAVDLAVEGEILSRLYHKNIMKLHGVYGGDVRAAYTGCEDGYFLVMDVLDDTLTSRLDKLRRRQQKRINKGEKQMPSSTMLSLIKNVALDVAMGMAYLHNNGVILRDLKPDNIGFTENGTPIIFDLGFARELHTVNKSEVAGSLRYMSPEIALRQGGTLASDVYSFGVLLFEMCSLEKPFKKFMDRDSFVREVIEGDYRPSLSSIPSKAIQNLISACWDKDQSLRPDMKTVVKNLRVELALLGVRSTAMKKAESTMAGPSTQRKPISGGSMPSLARLSSSGGSMQSLTRGSSGRKTARNQSFESNFKRDPSPRNKPVETNIIEFAEEETTTALGGLEVEEPLSPWRHQYRRSSSFSSRSSFSSWGDSSSDSLSGWANGSTNSFSNADKSEFTLGELMTRKMGMSRRSSMRTGSSLACSGQNHKVALSEFFEDSLHQIHGKNEPEITPQGEISTSVSDKKKITRKKKAPKAPTASMSKKDNVMKVIRKKVSRRMSGDKQQLEP